MTSPPATWRWARRTAERWLSIWPREPVLLAEAFRELSEPPGPPLGLDRAASPAAVAGAIARALIPAEASDEPPAWLRADQAGAFRRGVAAVRTYDGVLIAEPPGTGKTWIGLATARALTTKPLVAVVPATLVTRWRAVAADLGIGLEVHSHEAVSRGRLPRANAEVVVIDESHRFRHHLTRRYGTLAPWLAGRRGILLSATPVVNAVTDLAHQLRLFLRDDALAAAGLPSLRALSTGGDGQAALAEVIVAGWAGAHARPALVDRRIRVRQDRWLGEVLNELDQLALSTHTAVAALIRTMLWGAAASSPAALASALLRYLALLDQAEDAARSGRHLGREALRRFLAGDPSQLILWDMLPDGDEAGDLVIADRARVAALRAGLIARTAQGDNKLRLLRTWLADGRSSLVFSRSVATVEYLRQHLGPAPIAWCTGTRAGIGPTLLTRESVLAWFAPRAPDLSPVGLRAPRVLVATDVAAEGLDLQGADRVVHYDLPWTAIRVDQRAGRVRRLGSLAAVVEQCWILPPRSVARRLGQERILAGKQRLPGDLGLGETPSAPWRHRLTVARAVERGAAVEGIAHTPEVHPALGRAMACVRIESSPGSGVTRLYVWDPKQGWQPDDSRALELLRHASRAPAGSGPAPEEARALIDSLAAPVRAGLRDAMGREWGCGTPAPEIVALLRRLRHWARVAARARDERLLARLDAAVGALGRGRTAGEEMRLAHLARRDSATVQEHLAEIPPRRAEIAVPTVRLIGLVMFGGSEDYPARHG